MTTGFVHHSTGTWLDLLVGIPFVLGFWQMLANLLPSILGLAGGALGGNNEVQPQTVPSRYANMEASFMDWLSSQMYQKPDGGWDMYGFQAFPGLNAGYGAGSAQGPGVDSINGLSPDVNSTILPNVYQNWQPWDGGTQFIADTIYNKLKVGQDDPRTTQLMTQGGFGGPGHQGMATALQYGVPSEAGRYMANLAQFGVTSQPMGDFMKQAMQGGLNQYRKAPVPQRG